MIKRITLLSLTAILLAFTSCGKKRDQLHIYIWSDFISPEVVEEFEKQFNCKVIVDTYEDVDSMMAKMFAGGDSIYDIILPEANTLPILVKRGMVAPLPKEAIPNLKNIDPYFGELEFNKGMVYGAPYSWGITGIYARKPEGVSGDESWGLLFDPDMQPGPFLLLDDMRQTIGMALLYLGHSVNTTDPDILSQAAELLIETKKRSLGFENTVMARNRVLAREVSQSVIYSPDVAQALGEDTETVFIIPKEGSIIFQDVMSIPARAPHPELAAKFINFILAPEMGAKNSDYIAAPTPNLAAREFIDPALAENPAVYPPAEVIERTELVLDVGDDTKLFDELWSKIKSN